MVLFLHAVRVELFLKLLFGKWRVYRLDLLLVTRVNQVRVELHNAIEEICLSVVLDHLVVFHYVLAHQIHLITVPVYLLKK